MEKVYFSRSRKGEGLICKTEWGKISFVDKFYKGNMPKEREEWAVEILKRLEKVNIVRPLFKIDSDTAVEKLLELGFVLRLDFFNGELVVYDNQKEFKRFPYDGRWDNKMFFSYYSFPEAIRLHKLSKQIVESGKTAIIIDSGGRLVKLPTGSVNAWLHEYGYFCHIHEVNGVKRPFFRHIVSLGLAE